MTTIGRTSDFDRESGCMDEPFEMDLTGIDCLGLDCVLRRGTGEIIERHDRALLIRDSVSGAYMLGCEDTALGAEVLARRLDRNCRLLMVSDHGLGKTAFSRFAFSEMLECFQVAYYGEAHAVEVPLTVRKAQQGDLPFLIAAYDLLTPDELKQIVDRGRLLLGYDREQLVGFVGEHLEGSLGLLYVLPAFRRQGYALALERIAIEKTMEEGFIPFGQVEKSNQASLALQKKLGMTISDRLICWMWR